MVKQRQILNFDEFIKKSKVLSVLEALMKEGFEAYLAGGAVRDMLLGVAPHDFDIATNARPKDVKRIFPHHTNRGERFGTITVILDSETFEITTYRSEDVYSDSRHPDLIKFADSIFEDSSRRDFTINAMYADYKGNILDPQNGILDLDQKKIRTVGNPDERFTEDALRVLRAFRFSSQLGFYIEDKSLASAIDLWSNISKVSSERVYEEFKKMIVGKNFVNLLSIIVENKLLDYLVESRYPIKASYLESRMNSYSNSKFRFENFILDLALSQKNYFEFYLNSWKEFLPFRKNEKIFFDEAFYLVKYLGLFKNNFQKIKLFDLNKENQEPYVGRTIRLALNLWLLNEMKLFLNLDFFNSLDVDLNYANEVIKVIHKLPEEIVPLVTGKDLILSGETPGPVLREKINLAYEFQLENPDLVFEELISKLKRHSC